MLKQLNTHQLWMKGFIQNRGKVSFLHHSNGYFPSSIHYVAACVYSLGSEVSSALCRFCLRLLSCQGEANLLAVTYFKSSLPDRHSHIEGKYQGSFLLTLFHIPCFVPALIGFHCSANRVLPLLPVWVFVCFLWVTQQVIWKVGISEQCF